MPDELVERWRRQAAEPGVVLVEGLHALKHAVRFGADVRLALTTDRAGALTLAGDLAPDVVPAAAALLREVSPAVLAGLVGRVHATGVAALVARPEASAVAAVLAAMPRPAPIVVLENPRNLGNVGAVVRLAAGFGATGVITTGDADPWHPAALRGSAGLHFATAVAAVDLESLPDGPLHALDPDGEDIRDVRFPDGALLAFGSERHGVSARLKAKADRLVAVPMRPQVSSFNLATSVAMALFHWMSHGPRA
ncbi:MAG: RNA methyltransferase [Hamadaea sp.]|nr:RNA methyltransferase [Hamadaea sp.]